MSTATSSITVELLQDAIHPISGAAGDYDCLLELIGDARFVLLGEASHGTHEFYRERAQITKRLIGEKHFTAIAVEADWPDAYRVNRYVQGQGSDRDAAEALAGFQRFPAWMWRNADVLDLLGWLRAHNDTLVTGSSAKVGFYGLDLYSLHTSIEAVLHLSARKCGQQGQTALKVYSTKPGFRHLCSRWSASVRFRTFYASRCLSGP